MTGTTLVELAAAGLALWAAYKTLPTPPARDDERLWKTLLAHLLRAELEVKGEGVDAWEAGLRATLPFHPAGRDPERKLNKPDPAAIPAPALEGERALEEDLAALTSVAARFARLYQGPQSLDALCEDPEKLGAAYDPRPTLGPQSDWTALCDWAPVVVEGLGRSHRHRVFCVIGDPGLEEALKEALPGLRSLAWQAEAGIEPLEAALVDPADRLYVIAQGPDLGAFLTLLGAQAGLRDRLLALISLGAETLAGVARFDHDSHDTELNRLTLYAAAIDVDPAAPLARAWAPQRFPNPPLPPSGRQSILPVDLGPLVLPALPRQRLARALLLYLSLRAPEG